MQAADYRFVDVSGITIADKILPKTDGPDGGALPDRAEDFAFLCEAVNERGESLSPSVGMLVTESRGNLKRLGSAIRSRTYERQQGITASSYWCDIGVLGVLRDEEITGRAFDPLVLWPGIFPGRIVPTQFGDAVAIDDIRRMYRDLKRHEGFCRVSGGIHVTGTTSYSENGNVYYTTQIDGSLSGQYVSYRDSGDLMKIVTEHASLSVLAETGDVPPLGLNDAILVMNIVTEGRQNNDSDFVSRSFAKVIDSPTAQKVNAALRDTYAAAGFSESWTYAKAAIGEYLTICTFEGRTKLRNLAWSWEPSA